MLPVSRNSMSLRIELSGSINQPQVLLVHHHVFRGRYSGQYALPKPLVKSLDASDRPPPGF